MGSRIRLLEPNLVYSGVQGTVDRSFLFAPDHYPGHPLLSARSHPSALDTNNDIIPIPSTINIIGSSLARAMEKAPVDLHFFESNVNHPHQGFSGANGSLGNVTAFFQNSKSMIARQINKKLDREGTFFNGRLRVEPCLDDESVEEKFFYALTNVVKDGLVERVSESPFFSTYNYWAKGEPLVYWYIAWRDYWAAAQNKKTRRPPKDFLKWIELKLTPLPSWEGLSEHQIRTRVRQRVRDIEQECREKRESEKRTVVGVPRLFELDPRDRPQTPRVSTLQPLCHTKSRSLYLEYRQRWLEFLDEYREASEDYRNGALGRVFPEGSFRPPIVRVLDYSGL